MVVAKCARAVRRAKEKLWAGKIPARLTEIRRGAGGRCAIPPRALDCEA